MPSIWNKLLSGYLRCRGAGEKRLPSERETEAPDSTGKAGKEGQLDHGEAVWLLCPVTGSSIPLEELWSKSPH